MFVDYMSIKKFCFTTPVSLGLFHVFHTYSSFLFQLVKITFIK